MSCGRVATMPRRGSIAMLDMMLPASRRTFCMWKGTFSPFRIFSVTSEASADVAAEHSTRVMASIGTLVALSELGLPVAPKACR